VYRIKELKKRSRPNKMLDSHRERYIAGSGGEVNFVPLAVGLTQNKNLTANAGGSSEYGYRVSHH
jgi:hypothetical protein